MSLALLIISVVAWACDAQWAASYLRPCWVLLGLAIICHILGN